MVLLLDLRNVVRVEVEEVYEETKLEDADLALLLCGWLVGLKLDDGDQQLVNLFRLLLVLLAVGCKQHLLEVQGLHESVLVLDVAVQRFSHLVESSVVDVEFKHPLDDLNLHFEFFVVVLVHDFLHVLANEVRSQLHGSVTLQRTLLEGVERALG